MNEDNLKEILKEALKYNRQCDGIFFTPMETDNWVFVGTIKYVNQVINGIDGSFESKANGFTRMFQITQEEVERLLKSIHESTNPGICFHDWKLYEGVIHKDWYCVHCNEKKPWDWTDK